ncbi:hypothetical protein [Neisseria sp. S1]|uniref:hypothetical protein n=1 Tax=Neisseria sp. S1 TaxID=3318354 RepID=UPI003A835E46
MATVIIRNEEDIYQILQNYLDNENYFQNVDIEIESLPKLELRLVGEEFHSSITPTVMKAFIELQNGINRAYAVSKYGEANANRLTQEEKDELEFVVQVREGSSLFSLDFTAGFTKLLEKGISQMTGTQITISVLTIAIMWGGVSAFKYYLDYRKDRRVAEAREAQDLQLIEHLNFVSEQETERTKIIAALAAREPVVKKIKEISDESKAEAVKKLAQAETIQIGDAIELSGEQAEELVKNARKRSIETRLDGTYRILSVDSSLPDEFKVTVQQRGSAVKFTASVQEDSFEQRYKKILQENEWGKTPLFLQINATLRATDNSVIRATITKAENLPEDNEPAEE